MDTPEIDRVRVQVSEVGPTGERADERGSGTVEWLGISALSIGVLVALFTALESLGLSLIAAIGNQLGL